MFKKAKKNCNRAPEGWVCKLERGHEGSCPTWPVKQAAAYPARYYGDGGTIHSTGHIDICLDSNGEVVQVWYRCQILPFKVSKGTVRVYQNPNINIKGMEILDVQ